MERSRLDLAGCTSKTSSYPRAPCCRQSSPADPLEWQHGLISMEMGLIQVRDPPQVVAWLLTVRDEPDYLFTGVLHPSRQPPWSVSVWTPGQGSGTASALRASSLRRREGQKQSSGCSWGKPAVWAGPGCSHVCSGQYLASSETPCAGKMQ